MITQIYEIQTPREAARCVELGADHVGSVLLSAQDWRQPLVRDAVRETRRAGRKHSLIPLYGGLDIISRTLDYHQPDIVHFCDALLDPAGAVLPLEPFLELQERLRERFPYLQVMRSIPVRASGTRADLPSLELTRLFAAASDWLLIDAWVGGEKPGGFIGITGRAADWDVAAELVAKSPVPVILAGGLSPDNVRDAILRVQPAGVDTCTLTNSVDEHGRPVRFQKDFLKVGRFLSEARRARQRPAGGEG